MRIASFALLASLATAGVDAETLTGALHGVVRDDSGAAIAGADVRVVPEVGESFERETNVHGVFRVLNLLPGVYSVEVSAEGFDTHRRVDIDIVAGRSRFVQASLTVADVRENVDVTADRPLIERRTFGLSSRYGSDDGENVPRLRSDVLDFIKMAPGISATRPTEFGGFDVSSLGSNVNENLYVVDGVEQTSIASGRRAPLLGTESIQEIEIVSTGASAEYGSLQGAVINVVTRRGGGRWSFGASYYHQNAALTSQPIELDCDCPDAVTGFSNNDVHDFSVQSGGPLLPERLWMFADAQYRRSSHKAPGGDPRFLTRRTDARYFTKFHWRANPRLLFVQTFQYGDNTVPGLESPDRPHGTRVTQIQGQPALTTRVSYTIGANTLVDASLSSVWELAETRPNSGKSEPFRIDLATGRASGGSQNFADIGRRRIPAKVKLTHYADDFLHSAHELHLGLQYHFKTSDAVFGLPGGAHFQDFGGEPRWAVFRNPASHTATQSETVALFAQDVILLSDRATLSLGLRYERNSMSLPNVSAVDVEGNETGGTIPGTGPLFDWNNLAPRLGFSLATGSDGDTVVRVSFGRYYQGTFTNEFEPFHPGATPNVTAEFDEATGRYQAIETPAPPEQDDIDPELSAPSTDQFSAGIDWAWGRHSVFGVTYSHKRGHNSTGWLDVGGAYGIDTAELPDGRTLTVFPLLNDPSERSYILTNPAEFYSRFDGVTFTYEKRWTGRWRASASYTWSRARGLQASSARGIVPGSAQLGAGGASGLGRDPNAFINADGRLLGDRPHMLRVLGYGEIPTVGVRAGASFQYLSGTPWGANALVFLPQGPQFPYLENPGTRRLPAHIVLDLRFSKEIGLGKDARVEILVDVLNALNQTTTQGVRSTNFFAPQFGEGIGYVRPRRAMIGIKLRF